MAMIFQDPMSSLHPFYRIGSQLTEAMRVHRKLTKSQARNEAIEMLNGSASRPRSGASTIIPSSCPAACASG